MTTKQFKTGARVRFTTKDGKTLTGRLNTRTQRANGEWVEVNVAAPRQPAEMRYVRESQLASA